MGRGRKLATTTLRAPADPAACWCEIKGKYGCQLNAPNFNCAGLVEEARTIAGKGAAYRRQQQTANIGEMLKPVDFVKKVTTIRA
jgi:hypothetical protein